MPGGDGMGPMGMGSLSGRGSGYCAGSGRPGFDGVARGMGRRLLKGGALGRLGRGVGRGLMRGLCRHAVYHGLYGNRPFGTGRLSPEDEKVILQNQVGMLKNQLSEMENRLKELEADSESKA